MLGKLNSEIAATLRNAGLPDRLIPTSIDYKTDLTPTEQADAKALVDVMKLHPELGWEWGAALYFQERRRADQWRNVAIAAGAIAIVATVAWMND